MSEVVRGEEGVDFHFLDVRTMAMSKIIDVLRTQVSDNDPMPVRLVVRDRGHFEHILEVCRLRLGFVPVGMTMVEPEVVSMPSSGSKKQRATVPSHVALADRGVKFRSSVPSSVVRANEGVKFMLMGAFLMVGSLAGFAVTMLIEYSIKQDIRGDFSLIFDRQRANEIAGLLELNSLVGVLLLVATAVFGAMMVAGLVRSQS